MPTLAPQAGLLMATTVLAYAAARQLWLRGRQHPLLHPVPLSAAGVIGLLLVGHLSAEAYRPARELLVLPLGPATAALALPIYAQRARLRAALVPLAAGVVVGGLVTTGTVLALGAVGSLGTPVLRALAVKSVTTAIGVQLAQLLGGDPALAAGCIILTGTLGAVLGPPLLTRLGVGDPVARGVALGTVSHALGTAAALHEHEASGALSALAMAGMALLLTLLVPTLLPLVLGP